MIIHIAPWSNDPPRESGSSFPFPVPPAIFRPGYVRLFRRAVVLLSCNTGSPLFICEKGRISLSDKRVCEGEREDSTTRWGSAQRTPRLMPRCLCWLAQGGGPPEKNLPYCLHSWCGSPILTWETNRTCMARCH